MTAKQWTALGTVAACISVFVTIAIAFFPSGSTSTSLQNNEGNIAIGNTGPVTQYIKNLPSENYFKLLNRQSGKFLDDGRYQYTFTLQRIGKAPESELTIFVVGDEVAIADEITLVDYKSISIVRTGTAKRNDGILGKLKIIKFPYISARMLTINIIFKAKPIMKPQVDWSPKPVTTLHSNP
jgi:hypothetical protein